MRSEGCEGEEGGERVGGVKVRSGVMDKESVSVVRSEICYITMMQVVVAVLHSVPGHHDIKKIK